MKETKIKLKKKQSRSVQPVVSFDELVRKATNDKHFQIDKIEEQFSKQVVDTLTTINYNSDDIRLKRMKLSRLTALIEQECAERRLIEFSAKEMYERTISKLEREK